MSRPVVLVGPVGVGKTAAARELHRLSRRQGALVILAAGELTDTLYPDTLFGHIRGAYTGASDHRRGAFERSDRGTLVLDDLALLSHGAQAALLRAVEDRRFTPLGSERELPVTCREVYALTAHPADLADRGLLLPDLESRMGELIIEIPPLAMRREEIPMLAEEFARAFVRDEGLSYVPPFSDQAVELLSRYDWPRNLRELRSIVERAVLHALPDDGPIDAAHLPARLREHVPASARGRRPTLGEIERALQLADGNQSRAAAALGIHRNTLRNHLRADR